MNIEIMIFLIVCALTIQKQYVFFENRLKNIKEKYYNRYIYN